MDESFLFFLRRKARPLTSLTQGICYPLVNDNLIELTLFLQDVVREPHSPAVTVTLPNDGYAIHLVLLAQVN